MLKFDSLNIIQTSTSKTRIPRNLSNKYSNNGVNLISSNNILSNSINQTSANFSNATITDLSIGSLSAFNNTLNSYIVFDGAVAFSILKLDYINNDFKSYPILFTRDILINNDKILMNTNSLIIKDNVIKINNQIQNNTILNSKSDVFISGIIFPIVDKNNSTGNYCGLLYMPNLKIDQVNYNWTSNKYSYFTNIDKGFYKLKYLPTALNFNNYENVMDSNYIDLFDNNNNLSNLIIGALGITDGEIVVFNKEYLNINIGNNTNNIITINKTSLKLNQNIDIIFQDYLNLKTLTNIYINLSNNLISFNNNIILSQDQSTIFFQDNLLISSNDQNFIKLDNTNSRIEFFKDVLVNSLNILNNLQINFPNFIFNNEFNIGSNINNIFTSYINFTTLTSNPILNLLVQTYVNNLIINNSLTLLNNTALIFNDDLNFNSSTGNTFINISNITNKITFIQSVDIDDLNITSNITLNNSPVNITNDFIIQDLNKNIIIKFNINYNIFFYDIFLNKNNPKIIFNDTNTLNINSENPLIKLQINQNSIVISGPSNSNSTLTNIITSSSLNITNIGCTYVSGSNSFNYIPISKLFVSSGLTKPNENITFIFENIFSLIENTQQFSGKLNITSRSIGSLINIYDINLWSTPDSTIEFNQITPININNTGNWSINSIILETIYTTSTSNLIINCNGSPDYNVIWGLKLDGLSI